MEYIAHRRFRGKVICGEVNIPAMTVCDSESGIITHNGEPICATTSENAHQFFAINHDGKGIERGRLTQAIQKKLAKRDTNHQKRWDKVWNDPICQKYKRTEYDDYWLWSHDFFTANVFDLYHIAKLIGANI